MPETPVCKCKVVFILNPFKLDFGLDLEMWDFVISPSFHNLYSKFFSCEASTPLCGLFKCTAMSFPRFLQINKVQNQDTLPVCVILSTGWHAPIQIKDFWGSYSSCWMCLCWRCFDACSGVMCPCQESVLLKQGFLPNIFYKIEGA